MAKVAYSLSKIVHFGDVTGSTGDALVLDTVANMAEIFHSGSLVGVVDFTATQAAGLVTAGWLSLNPTLTGVPAEINGWGVTLTGVTTSDRTTITSSASAQADLNKALVALIADLKATGIIGA